jgi:hypothetical protein
MKGITIQTAVFAPDKPGKKPKIIGSVRHLDSDDPRNPNHPGHDEQWLEVARALGRSMADAEFDELIKQIKGE